MAAAVVPVAVARLVALHTVTQAEPGGTAVAAVALVAVATLVSKEACD